MNSETMINETMNGTYYFKNSRFAKSSERYTVHMVSASGEVTVALVGTPRKARKMITDFNKCAAQ